VILYLSARLATIFHVSCYVDTVSWPWSDDMSVWQHEFAMPSFAPYEQQPLLDKSETLHKPG